MLPIHEQMPFAYCQANAYTHSHVRMHASASMSIEQIDAHGIEAFVESFISFGFGVATGAVRVHRSQVYRVCVCVCAFAQCCHFVWLPFLYSTSQL